jgi:carbamoyltransferase
MSPGPIVENKINEKVILNHLSKNKDRLASVIHVDNSARIQTVENKDSLFFKLLQAIKERVGTSVCINTSFNVRGEPIVESPTDAVKCFLGTDLDFLAIEGFIVKKIAEIDSASSYAHALPRD